MTGAHAVGVDLGTTYTCAAVDDGAGPRVVQLRGTSQTIPSVVSVGGDEVLAGEAAERRLVSSPGETAREFKRRFGDPAPIVLGGVAYGAEVVTSHLLREVLRRVEQSEGGAPTVVGLAHPASWGPFRLDLLRQTAELAGVEHVELVPEPVAAAVANRGRVAEGSLVAVYDLGGGTFDAAVVRCEGEWSVVGTPEGVERLGGVDFDQAIMAHVDAVLDGQVFALDTSDPEARSALMQLRAECQAAKEHLSQDTDVEIPVSLPNLRTSVRLTRSEFEAMVRPRLADSLSVLDRVVASAGVSWDQIDQVLLVGGSSNIPAVGQVVSEHTGRPVTTATNPHLAIAAGTAAVTARRLAPAPSPAVAPVTVVHVDAPPEPPARTSRTGLVLGAIAVAAAVLVGAVLFLGGGGDDEEADTAVAPSAVPGSDVPDTSDAPETSDAPGTSDAPETSDAPGTSDAPETSDAPTVTDPSVGDPIAWRACTADADELTEVALGDAGAMIVLAGDVVSGAAPDAVDDCAIDLAATTPLDLDWTAPVTDIAAGDNRLALAGPDGGAIASPGRPDVVPCPPLTGEVAVATAERFIAVTADGLTAVGLVDGACVASTLVPANEMQVTTVDSARTRFIAGGTDATGTPTVRMWSQQADVPIRGADGGPVEFSSVDAVVGCGGSSCVFDLAAGVVHQIGEDGVLIARRPLDTSAGTITDILDSTSEGGRAFLLVRLDDGTTAIVRPEI